MKTFKSVKSAMEAIRADLKSAINDRMVLILGAAIEEKLITEAEAAHLPKEIIGAKQTASASATVKVTSSGIANQRVIDRLKKVYKHVVETNLSDKNKIIELIRKSN